MEYSYLESLKDGFNEAIKVRHYREKGSIREATPVRNESIPQRLERIIREWSVPDNLPKFLVFAIGRGVGYAYYPLLNRPRI